MGIAMNGDVLVGMDFDFSVAFKKFMNFFIDFRVCVPFGRLMAVMQG